MDPTPQYRLGIASVAIAATTLAFVLLSWLLVLTDFSTWPLSGLVCLLVPFLHLVGFVLGLVGVFRTSGKKLFPILGMVSNGLLGLTGALLWCAALFGFGSWLRFVWEAYGQA